jgi:hypothetical protein
MQPRKSKRFGKGGTYGLSGIIYADSAHKLIMNNTKSITG